ncbi:phosphoribosylformylglycinamidine synthase subunit PurQ [Weissella confusa]|uniref:Phosphoribosylformylglycinamidine synthase subunit PurQ n=1 Tax=Weissella confusa TaxID=1583 RepID=A0A923SQ03_WEICO|nr:phosphoribosylformylglycinamidine synthase subunit PurQ [Weissella confusa]
MNEHPGFICDEVPLEIVNQTSRFSKAYETQTVTLPVAHGEGRYVADEATLEQDFGVDVAFVDEKATSLAGFDAVFLPGGFSYGDYLRTGAVARFAPVMDAVRAAADDHKLVVGICNGF